MKRLFIGPKQSTIKYNNFFDASITLFGINSSNNISYQKEVTFEYWNPDNILKEISIYNEAIMNLTSKYEVMAFNPNVVRKCKFPDFVKLVCKNDDLLLDTLDNKIKTRNLLKNIVPMLNYQKMQGKDFKYDDMSNISNNLVIQLPVGSGGSKTYLCNKNNFGEIKLFLEAEKQYIISAYQEKNIPYNIHCVIGENQIVLFPASEQQLEITEKIEYIGSEYKRNIPSIIKDKIEDYSKKICHILQNKGYRGILGIDYIYANNELYFIEINPRFQGSTMALDEILKKNNMMSIFEYNYFAFQKKDLPEAKNMLL